MKTSQNATQVAQTPTPETSGGTMFKHLENKILKLQKEEKKKFQQVLKDATEVTSGFKRLHLYRNGDCIYSGLDFNLTERQAAKTLEEQKQIILTKFERHQNKQLKYYINKLEQAEKAPELKDLKIVVEWKHNRTWGANPVAESWGGGYYVSSSIGGCGYDKESTATAEIFNQNYSLLKELYKYFDKHQKQADANFHGCGIYNYYLPSFGGGCGFGTHRQILEMLGFKMVTSTSGRMFNSYYFEKVKRGNK